MFGLPVLGLQYLGQKIGGPESARWVAVMQLVLSGWILCIGATGMISEGIVLLAARRRVSADFVVATFAVAIFIYSCIAAAMTMFTSNPHPPMFHAVVIILCVWSYAQWLRYRSRLT